ncbi:MAG: hypothetical protein RR595_02880 [Lysinibacillus sp.]
MNIHLPNQANEPHSNLIPMQIQTKFGDVNGDGYLDTVFLTGMKTPDSPYWRQITLFILYGRTRTLERVPLKENEGYNPTIFLGDFTKNHVDDILIVSDTGGSGGIINASIFSYINGRMHQIFDAATFNDKHQYDVDFQNNYQVKVTSDSPKKKYILDLMYKGADYLSEIYNKDGTLKQPIQGWVDPIGGLYPIDFSRGGTYQLLAIQSIAGRYHADGLGYVENVLSWNGHEFTIDRQLVSIPGEDLT